MYIIKCICLQLFSGFVRTTFVELKLLDLCMLLKFSFVYSIIWEFVQKVGKTSKFIILLEYIFYKVFVLDCNDVFSLILHNLVGAKKTFLVQKGEYMQCSRNP